MWGGVPQALWEIQHKHANTRAAKEVHDGWGGVGWYIHTTARTAAFWSVRVLPGARGDMHGSQDNAYAVRARPRLHGCRPHPPVGRRPRLRPLDSGDQPRPGLPGPDGCRRRAPRPAPLALDGLHKTRRQRVAARLDKPSLDAHAAVREALAARVADLLPPHTVLPLRKELGDDLRSLVRHVQPDAARKGGGRKRERSGLVAGDDPASTSTHAPAILVAQLAHVIKRQRPRRVSGGRCRRHALHEDTVRPGRRRAGVSKGPCQPARYRARCESRT